MQRWHGACFLLSPRCALSDLKRMHGLYSYTYQVLLDQVHRDENIKMLLQDIHDVFSLGKLVDSLGNVKAGSEQAQILTAMLRHVCNCGDLIQSYAKNTQFCMSLPLILNSNSKHVICRATNHEVYDRAR
jgi:hypothetical protein